MPTTRGFDHMSGFNHPSDEDFLVLEALRNRLREEDSDSSDSEDGNPWLRRCRPNSKLCCPVCKADHPFKVPSNDRVSEENRYSHDARVIFASFGCPICLEDPAGPPMVVLPCGHAICQDDFRLLGGKTTNAEADARVRQSAEEETQQHQRAITRNRPSNFGLPIPHYAENAEDMDMDDIAMAMMQAFAASLNEAMETRPGSNNNNNNNSNTSNNRNRNNNNANNNNNNRNDSNNRDADFDSDESTDSEMPELIRPPALSFDSSDDDSDMPSLQTRPVVDSSDEEDGVPPLVRRPTNSGLRMHNYSSSFFGQHSIFPMDMLRFNRLGIRRLPSSVARELDSSSSDDSDSSYSDGQEDDDDDSDYQDPEEVLWRLSEYHPGNGVLSDPPTHPGFPRLGQWLLVPEIGDNNRVNLMYYCEYEEDNNLFVTKQFQRGTKMIPNGRHGVYVYTPPRSLGRRFPSSNQLWDVYYVKNSKPDNSRIRGRRGRQESAQALSTTVSDPVFRYKVPRNAQLVADGKGGIWALVRDCSLPANLREQVDGTSDGVESDRLRLVHYSRLRRDGVLVGESFPQRSKIFMEKSGGVILLQPNEDSSSSFSNLWHFAQGEGHPKKLLYRGLRHDTKVFGDSTGSSVFLLSPGGRLQSILTRVTIEYAEPETQREDIQGEVVTTAPRIITNFSYDLDIPIGALQDIVDIAEGDRKQVLVHARRQNDSRPRWKLCRISPRTEAVGERDVYVVDLDVHCPRNSRIVSDRESGVWVWKKPHSPSSGGDRGFVHVNASSEGQEEWISPCVFPPHTLLAALG